MLSIEERAKAEAKQHRANNKRANADLQRWLKHPLNEDLVLIHKQVPNIALMDLFAKIIRYFVTKPHRRKNPFRSSEELDQIKLQAIVSRVKDQVDRAPKGDERYLACRSILQDAIGDLKEAMTKQKKKYELEEEERKAIQEDQKRHDRIRQSDPLSSSNPDIEFKVIFIKDPGDPKRDPYFLRITKSKRPVSDEALEQDRLMITYKDIIWRLRFNKVARLFHLWARCIDPSIRGYAACPGLQWTHVAGHYPIKGTEFGVVDMANLSDSYIVALVDRNGKETIPRPIVKMYYIAEVPPFGKKTCCEPGCSSLTNHIQSIWRDSQVMNALMLPDDRCVQQVPLDSENFPPLRNDLYLEVWEPEEEIHTATAV
ncbi:hypothetical protein FRC16_001555 [Serendipita sp. 398]|nr:hypothetical protein FRC16_001555 [Serendipita sp. 398]